MTPKNDTSTLKTCVEIKSGMFRNLKKGEKPTKNATKACDTKFGSGTEGLSNCNHKNKNCDL